MHSTISLAARLSGDYPDLRFISGDEFRWDPEQKTIFYESTGEPAFLLHELSHALLDHDDYLKDVRLLEMERDAWEHAIFSLAARYEVRITEDLAQDALDSYRDWLHARSRCPRCSATGIQIKKYLYRCIVCRETWKVNDARSCSLRRYPLPTKNTRY